MAAPGAGGSKGLGRLRRWLTALAAWALMLIVSSLVVYLALVTHQPRRVPLRAVAALPPELDARFRCDPVLPLEVTLAGEIRVDGHRVLPGHLEVQRLGVADSHTVKLHLYFADGVAGQAPTILLTPILGGPNRIARTIADDLASHGMHAVIVDRRRDATGPAKTLEALEANMRDMLADRRRVIDWLLTRPEVDPQRLGAYGVSLGGITTVMLAAVEPRLRASVAVMPGGDMAALVARSVESEVRMLAESYGLTQTSSASDLAAFEDLARPILQTCPVALAPYVDPATMVLFTTRRDTSVPSFLQQRLRDALGGPETWSLPTGHYSAIIYLPLIKARARAFLWRRFALAPGA